MTDMRDGRGRAVLELQDAVSRIDRLIGLHSQVSRARGMTESALRTFDQKVQITGRRDAWESDKDAVSGIDMAKEVATRCRAEIFADHDARSRDALRAIAEEIDQIRRKLPALTTAAVVELGGNAKDLRFEAEHGSP